MTEAALLTDWDARTATMFIDLVQTAALVFVCAFLIYEVRQGAKALARVYQAERDLHEDFERIWRRIDALEMRQGLNTDVDALARLKRLVDAMEQALQQGDKENGKKG